MFKKILGIFLALSLCASNSFSYTSISRVRNFVDDKNNGIPITSSYVDAEFNQLITAANGTLIVKSSAPSSPFEGEFWYDSTNKILKGYRNAEWVQFNPVHYGSSAPATIQSGDTWYDSSGSEVVVKVRNKANSAWLTMQQSNTAFVSGEIIMWSGTIATIPSGFVLCDGTNSTPDLRNKFIVAANADAGGVAKSTITGSALQSGGSTTIAQANLPAVGLTLSIPLYSPNSGGSSGVPQNSPGPTDTTSSTYTTSSMGSGTAYTQPFYALAYIMKT